MQISLSVSTRETTVESGLVSAPVVEKTINCTLYQTQ